MKYPLIVSNTTLWTKGASLFQRICRDMGCEEEYLQDLTKKEEDDILSTYVQRHKGVTRGSIERFAGVVSLQEGTTEFFRDLHKRFDAEGMKLVLLTSDYQELASLFQRQLGFSYALGSRAQYDKDVHAGFLDGMTYNCVRPRKIEEICIREGLTLKNVLCLGSSVNDIPILASIYYEKGFSIQVGENPSLRRFSDVTYTPKKSFEGLLEHIIKNQ